MNAPQGVEGRVVAGRYLVEALLGRGGMASVFRARHTVTGRRVALKVLHPRPHWEPDEVERFVREARIATKLSHPNLVEVLDAGTDDDGAPFLALELLEGETLRARMTRLGAMPAAEVDVALRAVLTALDVAHRAGVVHRDVKPENVFVSREADGGERVRLLDFGISKVLRSHEGTLDPESLTRDGHMVGTVAYMSPEQLRGEEVDARADLWSVGVMAFEMLVGQTPFTGRTAPLLTMSVLMTRAPTLSTRGGIPRPLASLVDAMLAKPREGRPSSAGEALRRLDAPPADAAAPSSLEPSELPSPPPVEAPRVARRSSWVVGLIAAVTAAVVYFGARRERPARHDASMATETPRVMAPAVTVTAPRPTPVESPRDAGAPIAAVIPARDRPRPRRVAPPRATGAATLATPSGLAPMRPATDIDGT